MSAGISTVTSGRSRIGIGPAVFVALLVVASLATTAVLVSRDRGASEPSSSVAPGRPLTNTPTEMTGGLPVAFESDIPAIVPHIPRRGALAGTHTVTETGTPAIVPHIPRRAAQPQTSPTAANTPSEMSGGLLGS